MAKFKPFKWQGIIYSLLLLSACSSESKTVKEVCDSCSGESSVNFTETSLHVSDSLLLEVPDSCGEINSDIPPKQSGNNLYVLTTNNFLLKYDLSQGKKPECTKLGKLPAILPYISDYLVLKGSEVLFCTNEGTNAMVRFNLRTKAYILKQKPDTTTSISMPYTGLSLTSYGKENFIFPMVPLAEITDENHPFLAMYNHQLDFSYGIGNFRTYDADYYAPYYGSPILSAIENQSFYATTSSSGGVVKCNLVNEDGKLTLDYEDVICYSAAVNQRIKAKIKHKDMGDFKVLEEAYISQPYTIGLYTCGNALIRVIKEAQPTVNQSTHLKNRIMDAPWTIEIIDLVKKTGKFSSVDAMKFRFTNAFAYRNRFYVLSNRSDEKHITYYVLYE